MGTLGVRVDGLNEAVRSFDRAGVEMTDFRAPFRRIGKILQGEAKSIAPEKDGDIVRTILPITKADRVTLRAGGDAAPHAGVLHYGGGVAAGQRGPHNIKPHPFLTGAVSNKAAAIFQVLDEELERILSRFR